MELTEAVMHVHVGLTILINSRIQLTIHATRDTLHGAVLLARRVPGR